MIVDHCISREVWEQRIRFACYAKLSSVCGQKGIIIYSVYFMFVYLLVCGSILICKLYAYVWMFLLGNYYIYAKVRLSYDVKTFKRFFFSEMGRRNNSVGSTHFQKHHIYFAPLKDHLVSTTTFPEHTSHNRWTTHWSRFQRKMPLSSSFHGISKSSTFPAGHATTSSRWRWVFCYVEVIKDFESTDSENLNNSQ